MTHLLRVLQAQASVQGNIMYKIGQLNVRSRRLPRTLLRSCAPPQLRSLTARRRPTGCLRRRGGPELDGGVSRCVSKADLAACRGLGGAVPDEAREQSGPLTIARNESSAAQRL